jgi:hypothetical protein
MEPPQPQQPEVGIPQVTGGAMTGSPQGQPAPPLSPAERAREARAKRRRAMRQYLIVGLCFVGLLCLGGIGVGFLFYDRATKPDLSSPVVVTDKFISVYLVDRDDRRAQQYQCSDASGLAEIHALRDDLDQREKTYSITINVAVDSISESSRTNDDATVAVDLALTTILDGKPQRAVQQWQFSTRNEDGWRVCGAHKLTQ